MFAILKQVAQLSQRDRAARWISFGQKWIKTGTGRQYFADCEHRSIFNNCDVIGQQSYRIRWEKRKIMAITPFKVKVFEDDINRKSVYNFLLVINTNWHPISYHFRIIAAYSSNFAHCVFGPPFGGGGLGTTYDVHIRLMGRSIVDYLLLLIGFFAT